MTTPHRIIEGTAILDRLHAVVTKYVVLPSPEAIDAVVLWIAATHAQQAWAHAPRLVIRAPEKRCGKSRLLDVVEGTSCNPLITVNASTAAVYRSIGSDDPPTLLVDEADTIFGGKAAEANEELRGLLNAGHQRNRPTIRWDNARNRVEKIATFAMAALAGIGQMPDTIEDRAVVIRMRRRARGETVSPYRHRRDGVALNQLANDLNQWLRANLAALEKAEPTMPLEDRAADTWEPLIAVADLAGGNWPERGREAATALTAERDSNTVASDRVRLLTDCRTAIGDAAAIPTAVLLDRLKADPEAPWAEHGDTGLTGAKLAALLKEYDITSGNIRFTPEEIRDYRLTSGQAKGYKRSAFLDSWRRYCPDPEGEASQPSQPSQPSSDAGRLAKVVRLKPSQPALDIEMPPPPDEARGTA
ncbi:hypothetical protein Aca07nite_49030 [Actinoplanes capillaceus]|uniref:DUF3631 domain-containing protein n=1 Tax=Actinoplanes campanulatus TaxID=113559 RepID=A0ABQ3WN28_9ACTN|nr:DUF3631 domain-containing protein [Actinoplanes capillaceus]GID47628.1 hypothetical protein Aca07nite_49030 [Actinoplanes capillaceus]